MSEPRVLSRRGGFPSGTGAVYVGRPTVWGNPFEIGRDGTREQVVDRYREWLYAPAQANLLERAKRELAGRDLVCWCAPQRCHADVLLAAVNGYRYARYLRDTPFKTVAEWRQAQIDAIPEAERCEKCGGSGNDVILASNGGPGEVVRCWPCAGTGRKGGWKKR